jgi:hypothetical protein
MKKASEFESGVVSTRPELQELSPDALIHACHAILEAAAVLAINVGQLATETAGAETQATVDDALESIARIAKVTQGVQAAARAERRGPGVASSRPPAQAASTASGRRQSK